jgi:Ca-activated chloride channel family protein
MMRVFLSSVLCLLLAGAVQGQDVPTVTMLNIDVDLVELHVTVADREGHPIGGLVQANFKVTENGVEQPIAVFKHEDIPVSLGLIVDNSRSIEPRKTRLDAAALSFVQKSNPDDEVFIVHFDFDARLSQPFTGDRGKLEQTLAAAKPFGQTALYDSVLLALDTMQKAQKQKKALLLITDGIDNVSKSTLDQVVERLKRENVLVYVVGLLSQSGGVVTEESLIRIGEASGGRAYFPQTPEEARVMMEIIAKDLREQYTIAYRPTNPARDGSWRSVRVDISPPKGFPKDMNANYRRGYYAPEGRNAVR